MKIFDVFLTSPRCSWVIATVLLLSCFLPHPTYAENSPNKKLWDDAIALSCEVEGKKHGAWFSEVEYTLYFFLDLAFEKYSVVTPESTSQVTGDLAVDNFTLKIELNTTRTFEASINRSDLSISGWYNPFLYTGKCSKIASRVIFSELRSRSEKAKEALEKRKI